MKKSIKLSTWAKNNGYTYQGAYQLYRKGLISGAHQLSTGTVLVHDCEDMPLKNQKVVIYCRVSTPKQRNDLDTQADRLTSFAVSRGFVIDKIIKEVASGLNDTRPLLMKILNDLTITHLIVENKDRLTRFGFNYIETMLHQNNTELIVVNRHEEKDADLMQDFVSIITSMAARVYGARRVANKRSKLLEVLEVEETINTNEII